MHARFARVRPRPLRLRARRRRPKILFPNRHARDNNRWLEQLPELRTWPSKPPQHATIRDVAREARLDGFLQGRVALLHGRGERALVHDQRGLREVASHFPFALLRHAPFGDAGVAGEEALQGLAADAGLAFEGAHGRGRGRETPDLVAFFSMSARARLSMVVLPLPA